MYFYFVVGIVFVGIVCKSKDLLFPALFSGLLVIVGNETQCLDMVPRSNWAQIFHIKSMHSASSAISLTQDTVSFKTNILTAYRDTYVLYTLVHPSVCQTLSQWQEKTKCLHLQTECTHLSSRFLFYVLFLDFDLLNSRYSICYWQLADNYLWLYALHSQLANKCMSICQCMRKECHYCSVNCLEGSIFLLISCLAHLTTFPKSSTSF